MAGIDWEERRLCDDGGCTGVIGGDGRCHVCGRASQFWGDERRRGMRSDAEADADAAARRAARKLPEAEGEIAERRLCPDGGCTGLIGADGTCKVCGTVDESAPVPVRGELGASGAGDGVSGGEGEDDDEDEDGAYDDDDEVGDDEDDRDGVDDEADESDDDDDDDDSDGDDDESPDDDEAIEGDEASGRIAAGSGDGDATAAGSTDGEARTTSRGKAGASGKRSRDDERRLCPDGGCTGLIGADGRCKVCGARDEA